MVAEAIDDAEGEILKIIRETVGREVPVCVTLDLHANVSDSMVSFADALVSYQTYPHVDFRERGAEAARILKKTMAGDIQPRVAIARAPMLSGVDMGRTDAGPNVEYQAYARSVMQPGEDLVPGILNVSINAGFSYSDVHFVGPSATVTYDVTVEKSAEHAQQICDRLMKKQWDDRHVRTNTFLSCQAALEAACERLGTLTDGDGPIVIADFTDNPGAGTYGDATNLLRAVIDSGVAEAAFASICDPCAAQTLVHAGVGSQIHDLPIGGKKDPSFGGPPMMLSGLVVATSESGRFKYWGPMFTGLESTFGPSAVLRVNDKVDVVVATNLVQILDIGMLVESVGLDPRKKKLMCVKSMQHFRGAFAPIASEIFIADSGALATLDYKSHFNFVNVRRPLHPLDDDAGFVL